MEIKAKRCQECGVKRLASNFGQSIQTEDSLFDRCRPCIKCFNDYFTETQKELIIYRAIKKKLATIVPRRAHNFEDIAQEIAIRVFKHYDEERSSIVQHLSVVVKQQIGEYCETQNKQLLSQADWMNPGKSHFSNTGHGSANNGGGYSIETPEGFTEDDTFEAQIYQKQSIDYNTDSRTPNPLDSLLESEALGEAEDFKPKDPINGQIYRFLLQGKTQQEIALKLGFTQKTISKRIRGIKDEFKQRPKT